MKEINVTATGNVVTILEGKALDPKAPNKIKIVGDIRTVNNFLKVRKTNNVGYQNVDISKAVILVDKNIMSIELLLDPEDYYGAEIEGKLTISDELDQFCINQNKKFSRIELVKLIKMNRIFFEDKEKHAVLLESLQKQESTVDYSSKDGADDRGNKERQFVKKVTTNVPLHFSLKIPVFKGFEPESLHVDICLDVEEGSAKFWLESVELNELIQSSIDKIIEEELQDYRDFVIIFK